MFLNRLAIDDEKIFLKLVRHIAQLNGDFSEKEQLVIGKCCMEMQADDVKHQPKTDRFQSEFSVSGRDRHGEIALLEMTALVYLCCVFNQIKKTTLKDITDVFEITRNVIVVYNEWLKRIISQLLLSEALIQT